MLTKNQRETAAVKLKGNPLLKEILALREKDLIQRWRGSDTTDEREKAWAGLRELDILAGAIEDAIRKHSRTD